ncbi:MAG: hypothetical protein LBB53_02370, partial [Prevotellaceae bacterium]|nr:hypothetical protein [Prevotellaceae bacterium]
MLLNYELNQQSQPVNIAVYPAPEVMQKIQENTDNISENKQNISDLGGRVSALEGHGGALHYYDFGTDEPTQEKLTQYAMEQIWGVGGVFEWNSEDPAASTYEIDEIVHAAVEIFNATWLVNSYDNHRWLITNTPETDPAVFVWENAGAMNVTIQEINVTVSPSDWYPGTGDFYGTMEADVSVSSSITQGFAQIQPAIDSTIDEINAINAADVMMVSLVENQL